MERRVEAVPLLSMGDQQDASDEPPPAYTQIRWGSVRPIGSTLVYPQDSRRPANPVPSAPAAPSIADTPVDAPPPFSSVDVTPVEMNHDFPRSEPMAFQIAPHRVELFRGSDGFGFSISGEFPAEIVVVDPGSPASFAGLRVGDKLLELNGIDITSVSLSVISTLIASAPQLSMIVVSSLSNTPRALGHDDMPTHMNIFNGMPQGLVDSDQAPRTNMTIALLSLLLCPLFGLVAVYHAMQVTPLWRARDILAAYYHSALARRHAINAMIYGIMGLILVFSIRSAITHGGSP